MIWIEVEDVILIHGRIIQATGGIDGLRDRAAPILRGTGFFLQILKKSLDLGMD